MSFKKNNFQHSSFFFSFIQEAEGKRGKICIIYRWWEEAVWSACDLISQAPLTSVCGVASCPGSLGISRGAHCLLCSSSLHASSLTWAYMVIAPRKSGYHSWLSDTPTWALTRVLTVWVSPRSFNQCLALGCLSYGICLSQELKTPCRHAN